MRHAQLARSWSALVAILAFAVAGQARASDGLWETQPYRVTIRVKLDNAGLRIGELIHRVRLSVERSLRPAWTVHLEASDTLAGSTPDTAAGATPDADGLADKRFAVTVSRASAGWLAKAREHDAATDTFGPSVAVEATRLADLPAAVLESVLGAFRPIARFQRDPDRSDRVTLSFRAARIEGGSAPVAPPGGSLLLPWLIPRDRSGAVVRDRVSRVAWTLLVNEPIETADRGTSEAATPNARVISHTRRPFAGARRGRVDRVAIAAGPIDVAPTRFRLHAFDSVETPLPGYGLLVGPATGEPEFVAVSDPSGVVTAPAAAGVRMAHFRCGDLVVASVPFASGVDAEIVLPLLDERSRVKAEAEVARLREELIDTVARREILGERIRRLLGEDRFDEADELIDEVEALPGRSTFARRLDSAEREHRADHPLAKQRLARLFESTRLALGKALDPRATRDLAVAVDRARQRAAAGVAAGATEPADSVNATPN